MITVNHLRKGYVQEDGQYVEVLKDVSFHVNRGDVVAVIGLSGSGKTTLLRTLNMLDRPDGGQITIDGETIINSVVGDSVADTIHNSTIQQSTIQQKYHRSQFTIHNSQFTI